MPVLNGQKSRAGVLRRIWKGRTLRVSCSFLVSDAGCRSPDVFMFGLSMRGTVQRSSCERSLGLCDGIGDRHVRKGSQSSLKDGVVVIRCCVRSKHCNRDSVRMSVLVAVSQERSLYQALLIPSHDANPSFRLIAVPHPPAII